MITLWPRPRLAVLGLVLALGTACAGSDGNARDRDATDGPEGRTSEVADRQLQEGSAPTLTPGVVAASAGGGSTESQETGESDGASRPVISTPIPSEKPKGPQAPDFTLTLLDGRPVQLRDFAGKVLLIDFWATWCGPCRMSIPHLIELQKELGASGFSVLGVSLDQIGPDRVRPFVERAGINYPIAMGTTSMVRAYGGPSGIQAIPMAFLVDRQGHVATVIRGYRPKADLEGLIRPLLASGPTGPDGDGDGRGSTE